MNILVTGSEGFIGQHVVKAALERGHSVDRLDKKKGSKLADIPQREIAWYDCVIHLAAYIEVGQSFEEPWSYVENNLISLKKLRKANRVIFASSAAVYGKYSPYGYTKRLGEDLLPKNSVSLRIFNPFGPGENHDPETHIIPLLAKNHLAGRGTTLYQAGMQIRDFVHVEDVAQAFVLAAESDFVGRLDICDEPLSIRDVAELMDVDYALSRNLRDSGDTMRLVGDRCGAEEQLGWSPKKDVRKELQSWRDWF